MGFVGYYHRDALEASSKDFTQTADLRERAGSDSTRWDNRSLSGPYGNFTTGTANPDGTFTPGGFGRFHMQPGDGGVGVEGGSQTGRGARRERDGQFVEVRVVAE